MDDCTNLTEIRRIARQLLHIKPVATKFNFIVSHPFTCYADQIIPDKSEKHRPLNLHNEQDFNMWVEFMSDLINTRDFNQIYMLLNKAYALYFLHRAQNYISKQDMGVALRNAWQQAENIHIDPNLNTTKIRRLFAQADPKSLMEEQERDRLKSLPDIIELYRGVTDINAHCKKPFSWTTSQKIALWFAKRFESKYQAIWSIRIPKTAILAHFQSPEEEFIVDLYRKNIEIKQEIIKQTELSQ